MELKNSPSDWVSNLILLSTTTIAIIWMNYKPSILVILSSVISIFTILIFTRRMYGLTEVKSPVSNTTLVMSGLFSAYYFSGLYFNLPNYNAFTPSLSFLLLIVGVLSKIFMIDKVIIQFINMIESILRFIFDWTTRDLLNFMRFVLMVIGTILLLFEYPLNSYINQPVVIAYAIYAIVALLSSLRPWERRYISLRLIMVSITLSIQFINIGFKTNEEQILFRVLSSTVLIWSISIPLLYSWVDRITKGVITWIRINFRNIFVFIFKLDHLTAMLAIGLLFIQSLLSNQHLKIGFYLLTTLLFAVSFDFVVMRFIDNTVSIVYGLLYGIFRFFWNFLKFLYNIGFFKFLRSLFRELIKLFFRSLRYIYQNLVILLLYALASTFILLGIGVLFPSIFPPAEYITGNFEGNFLISLIMSVFIFALGILTFKEVYERRERFRLEVRK